MATVPDEQALHGVLRTVIDPELHDNIVDLGMVRGVSVTDDGDVDIGVALTVASCPLRGHIEADVRAKLSSLPGVRDVRIHIDAMNSQEKAALMSRARLKAREGSPETEVPATARVVAVSSGKGGVGKSTTAANLAWSLRNQDLKVGVLDADIWGFSLHRMLGVKARLGGKDGKIEPVEVQGLKVVTMGSLVDAEEQALMWRGLILTRAVEQFLQDVHWGELDYLVVDMPPGTGDIQMGLARLLPQAEMLLVTTPQMVAQRVAKRAANMAQRSHMSILGVVENMSSFRCEHGRVYDLFGKGGGAQLASELNVPFLAQIPFEQGVLEGGDAGTPIVVRDPDSLAAHEFAGLAKQLIARIPPIEMAGCTARIQNLAAQLGTNTV